MEHLTNSFCQQNKRKTMHILAFLFLYFIFGVASLYSTDPPVRNKVQVVVIDPGHGGKDPGALGSKIKEKEVVLNISLKLGNYIEQNYDDVKVIYTRKTDVFIPLDERARIANEAKADLFISIHANAVPRSSAKGTETFVIGRHKDDENFEVAKKENSVILLEENYETKYQGFDPNSIDSYIIFSVMQKTFQEQSLTIAKMVQDEFELKARRINRGVKPAGFVVLWMTTMPSILVETGFLTNADEENYLGSEQGQEYLASAIYRAFRKYKNAIEDNSNFESIAKTANEKADRSTEGIQFSDENSDNVIPAEESLHYKVQIMVSRNKIEAGDPYFKSYQDVREFRSGDWYKYAIGSSLSYKDIETFCDKVRKDFPDAFVIAVRNGEIISIKKALKEQKRD